MDYFTFLKALAIITYLIFSTSVIFYFFTNHYGFKSTLINLMSLFGILTIIITILISFEERSRDRKELKLLNERLTYTYDVAKELNQDVLAELILKIRTKEDDK